MAYLENTVGFLGVVDQAFGLNQVDGDGFLDQHVHAIAQEFHGKGVVEAGGHHDVDGIDAAD